MKEEIEQNEASNLMFNPIQDTQWPLEAESKLRKEELGMTRMFENKFIFSLNKNDVRYNYRVSAWAQLVLPNLYIGDYCAMLL